MTTIIIISIIIGSIPAIIIWRAWKWFEWNAWIWPQKLIDAFYKIFIGTLCLAAQLRNLSEAYRSENKVMINFPSGGIVHESTDEPEALIPRPKTR